MKNLEWWQWLLIAEICIVAWWMVVLATEKLIYLVLTRVFKRDLEQEAVDKVFQNRKILPGQTLIIKYKNGTIVTMSKEGSE